MIIKNLSLNQLEDLLKNFQRPYGFSFNNELRALYQIYAKQKLKVDLEYHFILDIKEDSFYFRIVEHNKLHHFIQENGLIYSLNDLIKKTLH